MSYFTGRQLGHPLRGAQLIKTHKFMDACRRAAPGGPGRFAPHTSRGGAAQIKKVVQSKKDDTLEIRRSRLSETEPLSADVNK